MPDLLVHCLFRDVLLNCVEGVLIRDINARMSLGLGSLNAYLNSGFLIVTLRMVATSS